MTTKDLARQVLAVLNIQQRYFRDRKPSVLAESKDAERRLRQACLDEISDERQGDLFGPKQGHVDDDRR
jgi:hypothetical protein